MMKKAKKQITKFEEPSARVRKSNVFVDGRYRFNLQEQKILLQIVSKIRMDEKEFSSYFVSWEELKKISNNHLDTSQRIDESCEKLKNKTIKVKKGDAYENFGFLSGWRTTAGKGVHFRIDPCMKEMLLDLLKEGNVDVKVLETHDKWIGITYKEDTELAQVGFKKMTEDGVYPKKLWN